MGERTLTLPVAPCESAILHVGFGRDQVPYDRCI